MSTADVSSAIIQAMPDSEYLKSVFGTVRTEAYRRKYRYRTLRYVRYVLWHTVITGTGHFGKFGTTSIPVPHTSLSSVRHPYRHRRYVEYRYNIDTSTEHFGKFGTSTRYRTLR